CTPHAAPSHVAGRFGASLLLVLDANSSTRFCCPASSCLCPQPRCRFLPALQRHPASSFPALSSAFSFRTRATRLARANRSPLPNCIPHPPCESLRSHQAPRRRPCPSLPQSLQTSSLAPGPPPAASPFPTPPETPRSSRAAMGTPQKIESGSRCFPHWQ